MKKLDFGQTLQLLGNLGIIVGILLLVYELNQNRHMMMAQTRNELAQEVTNILFELQNNAEMAEFSAQRDYWRNVVFHNDGLVEI